MLILPLPGRWGRRRLLRCILRLRLGDGRGMRRLLRRQVRRPGRGLRRRTRDILGRFRPRRTGGFDWRDAFVNETGLGRTAFHAELVIGGGMVPAVGAEHQKKNGG